MFKKIVMAAVVALAVFASACSSVQTASVLNGTKLSSSAQLHSAGHVNVSIWGLYLFNCPVMTGSFRTVGDVRMFEDTVTVGNAVDMLTGYAKAKYNCQVVADVQTYRTNKWIFPTIFFFTREVQASGNVLR